LERRWKLEGAHFDGVVEGRYEWTRDEAGLHGVFHVWRTGPTSFEGKYIRVLPTASGTTLTHAREEAWTEWARLPDVLSDSLRAAISRIPESVANRVYPWRLRRRLKIGSFIPRWLTFSLAAAAAHVDPRILSERMRADDASAASEAHAADYFPLTLYRSDLDLFPGAQDDPPLPIAS
jgi:hypothetical protein